MRNLEEAAHYSVDLVAGTFESLKAEEPNSVLDLGCGVGSSMFYLSDRWRESRFDGVTLSGKQATAGADFTSELGLSDRVKVWKGSFLNLPELPNRSYDLIYAIEAFIHGTDPIKFFEEAAKVAKPEGVLILVDDFPESDPDLLTGSDKKWAYVFQKGWLANTIEPISKLKQIASESGWQFHSTKDLTPLVDMNRPRDKAISLAVNLFEPLMGKNAYLNSLRGGHALQVLTNRGLLKYRIVVFTLGLTR